MSLEFVPRVVPNQPAYLDPFSGSGLGALGNFLGLSPSVKTNMGERRPKPVERPRTYTVPRPDSATKDKPKERDKPSERDKPKEDTKPLPSPVSPFNAPTGGGGSGDESIPRTTPVSKPRLQPKTSGGYPRTFSTSDVRQKPTPDTTTKILPSPYLPKPERPDIPCRENWLYVRNPLKGPYIPFAERTKIVTRFVNTCYGTEVRKTTPIPLSTQAIRKTAAAIGSKARIKGQHIVRHDHRCKCRDNPNSNDSCRCAGRHKITRKRSKGNMDEIRMQKRKSSSRRNIRRNSLPRQVRTYNHFDNSNSRFLGYY